MIVVIVELVRVTVVTGERPLISAKGLIALISLPRAAAKEAIPSNGLVGLAARGSLKKMPAWAMPATARMAMENFMLEN